ncbi:MAG: acetyl-CoA carboxylase biotin carboxylase subunit [bacterium JZ-2024 1]
MFKKVLIANRGEIAVRIIRACWDLGVKTAVVYSEADQNSLATQMADEVISLGAGTSLATYLHIDKIIDAARTVGADAVHPGYGFLSENADFARAVQKAGLVFIGPSPEVIRFLGDKVRARKAAEENRISIVPGSKGALKDVHEARKIAADVGYPVLLKAVGGGGGRGMRLVKDPAEMERLFEQARTEANAAFGNPHIYLEKYIQNPHHVEVQILADKKRRVVHLFERECSVQRKHQKLLEESPSPILPPKLKDALLASAVRMARALRYESAGTFEYLYDADEKRFYFMEVNTRIQVEHPVTEMVTGVDIVKEQIRVASGMPLSFKQKHIRQEGHAIECRINAEDPARGFTPTPGIVRYLHLPSGPGIRVDTHLYAGYEIPNLYDSLVAKIIAHGHDRDEAIVRMKRALAEFQSLGVKTIVPFHQVLLEHPKFLSGQVTTRFIEEEMEERLRRTEEEDFVGAIVAALIENARRERGGVLPRREPTASLWSLTGRQDLTRGSF